MDPAESLMASDLISSLGTTGAIILKKLAMSYHAFFENPLLPQGLPCTLSPSALRIWGNAQSDLSTPAALHPLPHVCHAHCFSPYARILILPCLCSLCFPKQGLSLSKVCLSSRPSTDVSWSKASPAFPGQIQSWCPVCLLLQGVICLFQLHDSLP